jgi:hypothetical protein
LSDVAQEARGGQGGEYLFDLEHFFLLHRDPSVKEKERLDLPPLPAEVFHGQEGDNDELLVIDANSSGEGLMGERRRAVLAQQPCAMGGVAPIIAAPLGGFMPLLDLPMAALLPFCEPAGNLARFINHSCEPNLIVQPVLRKGDSGMRYCVAIFAAE